MTRSAARGRYTRWAGAAILALAAIVPGAALAQKGDTISRARTLANEGGDLLDRKEYEAALQKLEQAESLYHAPTHLSMIGQALEGLGRLAAAVAVYERLTAEPLPARAPAAFKRAQEEGHKRLRDLLARVPSLLVEVHGADAYEVTLDGEPFEAAAGVARRVDPGRHVLRVTAEGREPEERTIELAERGGVVKIEIALSKPQPDPAPSGVSGVSADAEQKPSKPFHAPAIAAFTVGAVALGVGAVTGILSLNRVAELEERCPNGKCSPAEQDTIDSAGALGTISTIGFVVGGAGIAAGVLLLVAAPNGAAKPTAGALQGARPRAVPIVAAGDRFAFAGVRATF